MQVGGRTYRGRALRHNLFEMNVSADDGLDGISRVSVTLANADSYYSQIERNVGWKGAKLTVQFLFFDLKNGVAASEQTVLFQGVANPPEEITESTLRITFTNRLGLHRVLLPEVRIQRRCPWSFPTNASQRQEAVAGGEKGKFSSFYRCGYSADLAGGAGNLNGGAAFSSCGYTRTDCEQRGMFDRDSQNRLTRRFGGIEFVPASILVRSHGERGTHLSAGVENLARYNDFVPIVYGTAWYQPPVVFARNDGNLTRLEALLGLGDMQGVVKVVVNDVEIPRGQDGTNMTGTGWFNVVSLGGRSGGFNLDFTDQAGQPVGDPYGSMAYLSVVVPNRIHEGKTLPRVQVLAEGLRLSLYNSQGTYSGEFFTNNPAWVLLDILRRSGWDEDEIDLASVASAAQYCDEPVPAYDLNGNAVTVARFQCNLVLRRRRSAADVMRGIRNSCGLQLSYGAGGKLRFGMEASVARQQAQRPEGSNSQQPLNGGWPAYEFGDGSTGFGGILRKEDGEPCIRLWSRSTADTPNRLAVEFQDIFNEYQQDSLSLVQLDDVLRAGQEISAEVNALGIPNFNQAARVLRRHLKRGIFGNQFVEFGTSVKGLGLRPGDLIAVTYGKAGFQRQPLRIVKIAPGLNHRTMTITAQLHDDAWYADTLDTPGEGMVARRQPGAEVGLPRPLVGAVLDENGEPQLAVTEQVAEDADGNVTLTVEVGFTAPAAPTFTKPGIPLVSLTPTISTIGGSLAGDRTLYYAVSAVDAAAGESPLSFLVHAVIPAGTNTNTVTLNSLSFAAGTAGFHVYRGKNPSQLLRIASNVAPGAAFTDGGLANLLAGPPDENYDHARFHWRMELVPEVAATIYSANTIGNSSLQMAANEHVGMVVRITRGKGSGQERAVGANTPDTLTISGKWDITPDATSRFVVAESSWRLGAASATSPAAFEIPNREGATVHISGRAVNARMAEAPYELSPLARWRITGSSGSAVDTDVPPPPVFGLYPSGQGTVELVGVGFTDLTNTRTIEAGTLTLHYWDELSSPSQSALGAGISSTDTLVTLAAAGAGQIGDLIQIDSEVLAIVAVQNGGLQYQTTRGSHGTSASNHATQAVVYHLKRKVFIVPFPRDFFGSPASGSFSYPIFLPDARLAAASLMVTNSRGNSETSKGNFTATVDAGLRTLSGGQLTIQVEGYLAIQTGAAPPLVIEDAHSVRDVFAVVREAPTGGPVHLELKRDGALYCSLTIPVGATTSNTAGGFGLAPLGALSKLTLDIISVSQTADSTPGRDLTVTVRL